MIDSQEIKRNKARNLRYKKPLVKEINIDTIRYRLGDIAEECYNVRWYWDNEEDTPINALIGDEDEEQEFKMMFSDL